MVDVGKAGRSGRRGRAVLVGLVASAGILVASWQAAVPALAVTVIDAKAPVVTPIDGCGQHGSVQVPSQQGVVSVVSPTAPTEGQFTVTATAQPGYTFAGGATVTTFSGNLGAFRACGSATPTNVVRTAQFQLVQPPAPTVTVPPGDQGDGYNLAFYGDRIFYSFHHDAAFHVACNSTVTGQRCWETASKTITDATGHTFTTSSQSSVWVDQATGKLYGYGVRTVAGPNGAYQVGVVCVDVSAGQDATFNPFCGFTPLAEALTPRTRSTLGGAALVGTKMYALNYDVAASSAVGANRLMCFDMATGAACPGQPFDAAPGASLTYVGTVAPAALALGGRVYVQSPTATACWDTTTGAVCPGWPIGGSMYAPLYPLLGGDGAPAGVCLSPSTCVNLSGLPLPAPPAGIETIITASRHGTFWNAAATILGSRVYTTDIDTGYLGNDRVMCWDFATGQACPGFPRLFVGLGGLYSTQVDPLRPTCLWTNGDRGQHIQAFDAYTTEPCATLGHRGAWPSMGAAPCIAQGWKSLKVLSPAGFGSAGVQFFGATTGASPVASAQLDERGSLDLSGLHLPDSTQTVALVTSSPVAAPATVEVTWATSSEGSGCPGKAQVTAVAPTITQATCVARGGVRPDASVGVLWQTTWTGEPGIGSWTLAASPMSGYALTNNQASWSGTLAEPSGCSMPTATPVPATPTHGPTPDDVRVITGIPGGINWLMMLAGVVCVSVATLGYAFLTRSRSPRE